jgi:two-component system, cell cycle sensor histidine kinase and response regulator CckA
MEMELGKGEWILLVEDDHVISSLLEIILTGSGYNIVVAGDGEEAMKIYNEHQPMFDLVISDLGLPKLGGVELFTKLYSENPQLKFIASSGFGGHDLIVSLKNMGVKAFIPKPYIPEDLFKILRNTLDS